MFLCMRTTVDINDELLTELKRVAAETHRSLKDLIEDAIRASLAPRRAPDDEASTRRIVTFRGNGVRPGVNLDNMRELLDIMEGSP